MNLLIASIHYAARQFRESRVFTAADVLTLALGIGGTTAMSFGHLTSMRQNETHFGSVRLQPDLSEPDQTPPRPTTAAPPFPPPAVVR